MEAKRLIEILENFEEQFPGCVVKLQINKNHVKDIQPDPTLIFGVQCHAGEIVLYANDRDSSLEIAS